MANVVLNVEAAGEIMQPDRVKYIKEHERKWMFLGFLGIFGVLLAVILSWIVPGVVGLAIGIILGLLVIWIGWMMWNMFHHNGKTTETGKDVRAIARPSILNHVPASTETDKHENLITPVVHCRQGIC